MAEMSEESWDALPIEQVNVDDIVFMLDNLSIPHIFPDVRWLQITDHTPIRLALLSNGTYLVRDGRHRVIRAKLEKRAYLPARVWRYNNV